MTKHAWLVALFLSIWLATGCGEVESCREVQTPGCLNSTPRATPAPPCLFDLVLRDGLCVKPGSDADKCSLCGDGSLCVPERNACVDFCAVPTALQGSAINPDFIACEAIKDPAMPNANPMLSFADVCKRRCDLRCQRLAQFCPGYQCPQGSCELPDVQTKCAEDCPPPAGGGNDLACLTKQCNDARYARCDSSLTCPNGVTPACSNILCTNDCIFKVDGQPVTGDGVCDDGDVLSSRSPYCDYGTDCVDCGPRSNTAPAPGKLGDLCQWGSNCEGNTGSPSTATAWCVKLGKTGAARCVPDCSRDTDCADGFGCFEVTFESDPGSPPAAIREGDLVSSACLPLACK